MQEPAIPADEVRHAVRERYAALVQSPDPASFGCCSSANPPSAASAAQSMGYSQEDLAVIPTEANLGVSCGNPVGLASLQPGQRVLDLGSGAGMDVFLAAHQVGPEGRVIGVDMTPEMIAKARQNARKNRTDWVEFRLGEIECLPVEASTIDVILSNCVINLSPEKERVLQEAYRVLKPGGRLALSDVVLTAEMPAEVKGDLELYSRCALGAWPIADWERTLAQLGFEHISVRPKQESRELVRTWSPQIPLDQYILSADISATKPVKSGAKTQFTPAVAELVAIGAAIAANCEPCLKHHYREAHYLGVSRADMASAAKMAANVKDAPHQVILRLADKLTGTGLGEPAAPADPCCGGPATDPVGPTKTEVVSMPLLKVFDPPMCCSTGVCGVDVDPKLSQLAADLKFLKSQGIRVERHNLRDDAAAFTKYPEVIAQMGEANEFLPIFMVDGRIVSRAAYPDRQQLSEWLGMKAPAPAAGECGPSCCCGG